MLCVFMWSLCCARERGPEWKQNSTAWEKSNIYTEEARAQEMP